MHDKTPELQTGHIQLTADIVAAFVSNNSVPVGSLADLLSSVHCHYQRTCQREI